MTMKKMIWHQLKSEWKNYTGFTLVWSILLCFLGYLLFSWDAPYVEYAQRGLRETNSEGAIPAIFGMVVVIILFLFKRDDLRDPRAFWQTRPMREQPLFIAKLVYFLLIIVLPLSLLFFVNMWVYDSLTSAMLTVLELWLWIFTFLGILVLALQHHAGWLRVSIPLFLAALMTFIGLLILNAFHYYIPFHYPTVGEPFSYQYIQLWFKASLLLAAIILNVAWLRHIKSRWNTTKPWFYVSFIFIVIAGLGISEFIHYRLWSGETVEQGVEVVMNENAIRHSYSEDSQWTTYIIELGLEGLSTGEIATNIVRVDVGSDNTPEKWHFRPCISDSIRGFFPPQYRLGMRPRQRGEIGFNQELACSVELAVKKSADIPDRIHLSGYAVFEISRSEEILKTPWHKKAHARGNGWEIDWRISRNSYGNIAMARVKQVRYPLQGWGYLHPELRENITFGLTNDVKKEYVMVHTSESGLPSYLTHRRTEFSVNGYYNIPKEWRDASTLHVFRTRPVRFIKVPIDMWVKLK